MNRKSMAIISLVLVIAMIAVSVWAAAQVPAGARLPTHWDAGGHANGFADKWTALFMPAIMVTAISLLFYFLPAIEPRGKHLQRSQGLVLAGWGGLLLISIIAELTIVSGALHWTIPLGGVKFAGVGLMFVLIGNQLGKSRSMFLVGIRTPWTLSSEDVWIKTNRLGGKLMMAAGVVMIVTAFLPVPGSAIRILMFGLVAVMAGVSVVYSYVLWRWERAAAHTRG